MILKNQSKDAFTLIEVMISVIIISIVITALLEILSNNSHTFLSMKKQTKIDQYSLFLLSNTNSGFEDENIYLDRLVDDFNIDSNLKKELKQQKIDIKYQKLEQISMNEQNDEDKESSNLDIVFEVGKTILKTQDSSVWVFRLKIQ
jgi:prepilin-type N-terminal cleavage/methylation domain-containing protein